MRTWLVAVVALAACGDEGAASVDAAVDTGSTLHPIVGRWERQPFDPKAPAPVVVFQADGRYLYDDDVGTWSLAGDHLTTKRTQYPKETAPFYLSEDHATLMTVALFPTTPTAGLVGTWAGDYTYADGTRVETTFEYRDDESLTWTELKNGVPRIAEGTWHVEGSSILIQATLGTTPVTVGMKLIPDVVIGDALHERLE